MALEATPVSIPSPTVLEALRAKYPPAPTSPPDWTFPAPDPHLSAPFAVFSKVLGSFPGGAEAIIHITRTYLAVNTGALVLQADLANAFNSVNQAAIVASLRGSTLESLLPLVKLLYGLPSALCLDAGFSHPPLLSETRVRQRDPLGPLLFAATIHPALTKTALAFPSVVCLAYADDVTFLGEAAACAAAFEHFTGNLGEIGLRHNPAKCAAWSQASRQEAALPLGVPFTDDGVKMFGSFIGGVDATAAFLRDSLNTMGGPLPLIARMEPQLASLLRQVSYVARTTPLSALPVEEWSDWGKRLFETLLTACGIRHPRGEAEITRTWAQASLPISLGGLGLADPSVEGRVGFLASWTQAQHLLTSIDEPALGALAEIRIQMKGPFVNTSPLFDWLERHNPAKCGAWSDGSPADYTLPEGVPLSGDGLKVLGSFIGTPTATSAFIRSSLEAMGAPLGLIERMEPQLAGLLLSRCVSRRVSYLARTTPLPALPQGEWSEWGRRLLDTLLTACDINHPRGEEEISRTWAQASLPVSLGGLGLTDPSVEGSYSFLASYTQAHLLLDSLEDECTGPLEATREATAASPYLILSVSAENFGATASAPERKTDPARRGSGGDKDLPARRASSRCWSSKRRRI
ncbi:unnamed protein product [Closterium sp. Naga37s-1]|nr:unnamed protein product [Closterium sp. Naga37s-1]